MKRELTCIICPVGCQLTAENIDGKVIVSGNTCTRGVEYAKNELINPLRTVTTTIRCVDGSVASVKTKNPISKDKIFDCMKIINSHTADLPIEIGDVIIEDIFGTDIVATCKKTI